MPLFLLDTAVRMFGISFWATSIISRGVIPSPVGIFGASSRLFTRAEGLVGFPGGNSGLGRDGREGFDRLPPGGGRLDFTSGLDVDAARCDPGLLGGRGGKDRIPPVTCLGGSTGLEPRRDSGSSTSETLDGFLWGSLLVLGLRCDAGAGRRSGRRGTGSLERGGEAGEMDRF